MKIAIVGTGKLGSAFAEACCAGGMDVTIWNRTREKTALLAVRGAKVAERAADAVAGADVIVSAVSSAAVIRGVFEESAARSLAGATLIGVTTTSSVEARRLEAFVKDAGGAEYLDVAVTSWPAEIALGKGSLLLGCSTEAAARHTGFLEAFGTATHVGGVGSASTVEMAFGMQLLMQQHMHLSGCALVGRSGLPIEPLTQLVEKNGAFSSPMFRMYSGFVGARTYTPAQLTAGHHAHLLGLFIEELEAAGMDAGIWRLVLGAARGAAAIHGADADWTSVYEALR